MANKFDYSKIFGSDFSTISSSLDALPKQVERMLLGTMDSMIFQVDNFAKNLEQTIYQMTANGVKPEIIMNTLRADQEAAGRIFGKLRNDIKGNVAMGIANAGRIGAYDDYTKKDLFAWITVGGHKICLDCDSREGMEPMPYSYWEDNGVPGSGWSVCKGYCYCVLDPVGKGSGKMTVDIKEKTVGSAPKKTKTPGWHSQFNSGNQAANIAFRKAFQKSPQKFQEFIKKFPELKHIAHGRGGSFHTTGSWSHIEKYLKAEGMSSREYLLKHGGINMSNLSRVDAATTIRHEYGHFLHQNLHYQGLSRGQLNDLAKRYRANPKYKGNPRKFIMEETMYGQVIKDPTHFAYGYHEKVDGLVDFLKFDDACVATKKRLGVPMRSKAAKEIYEKKYLRYKELKLKVKYGDDMQKYIDRYGEIDYARKAKVKDIFNSFPKNDKFIKAFSEFSDEYVREYFDDLLGALTKEKLGSGHGVSYYTERGFVSGQHHETFANLTCLYTHENPLMWKFVKQEMPELAKYFEDLIDNVLDKGYFGH